MFQKVALKVRGCTTLYFITRWRSTIEIHASQVATPGSLRVSDHGRSNRGYGHVLCGCHGCGQRGCGRLDGCDHGRLHGYGCDHQRLLGCGCDHRRLDGYGCDHETQSRVHGHDFSEPPSFVGALLMPAVSWAFSKNRHQPQLPPKRFVVENAQDQCHHHTWTRKTHRTQLALWQWQGPALSKAWGLEDFAWLSRKRSGINVLRLLHMLLTNQLLFW